MSKVTHKVYWPYIALSYACLFSLGILDNSRGPFFPDIIKELQVSDAMASLFFVVPSAFAILGSHVMPKILQSVNVVTSLRFSLLGMCLSFFTFSIMSSFWGILGAGVLFGISFGMLAVGEHVCIQEGAPQHHWRRLFSGLHSMYAFASLSAPLLISYFMTLDLGWRVSFQFISVVAGLSVFLSFLISPMPSGQGTELEHKPLKINRNYFYMATLISCYVVSEITITTRYALFLRRGYDYTPEMASLMVSLFFVFLLIGRLTFTFFKFERLTNKNVIYSALIISFFVNLIGLLFWPPLMALCGLTMAPLFAIFMDYLEEVFPKKSNEAIAATMTLSSIYVISMHYIVGLLTDLVGITKALFVGPVFILLTLLMLALQKRVIKAS